LEAVRRGEHRGVRGGFRPSGPGVVHDLPLHGRRDDDVVRSEARERFLPVQPDE
jgi:isoleucyl-tRNA synthetase